MVKNYKNNYLLFYFIIWAVPSSQAKVAISEKRIITAGYNIPKRYDFSVLGTSKYLGPLSSTSGTFKDNRYKSAEKNLCKEKSKKFSLSFSFAHKVSVFKRDGSVQCPEEKCTQENCSKPLVVLPKEMAKSLESAGIRVFKALQGTLPRGRGMAVCGAPTHNINIFYIAQKQKQKAIEQGFKLCIPEEKDQ